MIAHEPPLADLVANFDVFYRWTFAEIGAFRADVETLRGRPVVVGVGETSDQGAERAARELARRLGREPVSFAGDHVGFAVDPACFIEQLAPLLVRGIGAQVSQSALIGTARRRSPNPIVSAPV